MARIAEVMSRSLVGVSPDTCVAEAERLAMKQGVEHLLVLDDDDLVGILTVGRLRAAPSETPVGDCMSPVHTIRATASTREAAELMRRSGLPCLPVVAGSLLLGVVTPERL